MANGAENRDFADVLDRELRRIRFRRRKVWEMVTGRSSAGTDPSGDGRVRGGDPVRDGEADHASSTAAETVDPCKVARLDALNDHLVGLAISGGGIRSATFALGVLQGLADLKLLSRFDYLSTVSGGGYIGGWLAAWIKREGDPLSVERQLSPNRITQAEPSPPEGDDESDRRPPLPLRRIVDEEPEPIHHLRSYSNYLTPRPGLLSVDTWTVLTIYIRNGLINQLLLLPLTMIAVLLGRLIVWFFAIDTRLPALRASVFWVCSSALLLAFFSIGRHIAYLISPRRRPPDDASRIAPDGWMVATMSLTILTPLTLAAVLACWSYSIAPTGPPGPRPSRIGGEDAFTLSLPDSPPFVAELQPNAPASVFRFLERLPGFDEDAFPIWARGEFLWVSAIEFMVWFGLLTLSVHLLGFLIWAFIGRGSPATTGVGRHRVSRKKLAVLMATAALTAGATGGFLFFVFCSTILWPLHNQPHAIVTVGPSLALLVVTVATFVEVWMLAHWQSDAVREWWARVCSWMIIIAGGWLAFFGITLYGPMLVQVYMGSSLSSGVGMGWLLTALGGAYAGRSPEATRPGGDWKIKALIAVAPTVFLAGLMVLVSLLVDAIVFEGPTARLAPFNLKPGDRAASGSWVYWNGVETTRIDKIGWGILGCAVMVTLASVLSNINRFSLNAMYATRLTRCYLGASRRKREWLRRGAGWGSGGGGAPTRAVGPLRWEDPITGFDADDDIPLHRMRIGLADSASGEREYLGPQMIINTALNLVAGRELAWQDRRAESFIFTPDYCGSKGTGYAPTGPATESELTLGRAISISGAAVDSNIGVHQSSALIALMTAINARLGWWMRNPNPATWVTGAISVGASVSRWDAGSPSLSLPLLLELFGRTDERREWIHLSDGGHFENLAVYELIRRRCRYIVCCDAGTDPGASDDNLANMIRLCRTDFGVRIDLDTSQFARHGDAKVSRSHCAVGRIRYDDVDGGELPGLFVYLRTTLTGDEPPDVQEYAAKNPDFPWQSTLDQFFDEAQFESYRALGFHVAQSAFRDAVDDVEEHEPLWSSRDPEIEFKRGNQRLFSAVKRRWTMVPPGHENRFLAASDAWSAFQEDLLEHESLAPLGRDIYPEPVESASGLGGPDLHAVTRMVQIMEEAWIGLGLRDQRDLPMNRGWFTVFRRWADTTALRRHWPILRGEFSEDFVAFCEEQLNLGVDCVVARLDLMDPAFVEGALRTLGDGFVREWPMLPPLSEWLRDAEASWDGLFQGPEKPLWLLVQAPRDTAPYSKSPLNDVLGSPDKVACGIFFARALRDPEGRSRDHFDVFLWLRKPYRGTGIVSRHVRDLLIELRDLLWAAGPKRPIRLQFRYPDRKSLESRLRSEEVLEQKKRYTMDDDMEFVLWRNLLSHYDFRIGPDDRPIVDHFWVIEREFDINYLEAGLPPVGSPDTVRPRLYGTQTPAPVPAGPNPRGDDAARTLPGRHVDN